MSDAEVIEVAGQDVKITNPEKIFFPTLGVTKLDLARYYLSVMDGALTGARNRPTILKRHPNGVDGDFFYQKRVPAHRPEWIKTAHVTFPSGRTANFMSVADAAHVIWAVNLGCMEFHPWPVRDDDVDHPDELRIDLDPTPQAPFADVRRVALIARDVLEEHGLRGFPKTSGKRGIHVYVRIERRWEFTTIRRAALALGREVERRAPSLVTTAWWKEQRHGVFVDYNQNARDRTIASAYSVRPAHAAFVAAPLNWDEVADADPQDFTIVTVPKRYATIGDPGAQIDERVFTLDSLLELADRDEREGLGDAPWPPNFAKGPKEPKRVAPSRAAKPKAATKSVAKRRR